MKKSKVLDEVACFLSFGLSMVLFITFLAAYVNGYSITVTVNSFGEAHVELVLLSFIFGLLIFNMYKRVKHGMVYRI